MKINSQTLFFFFLLLLLISPAVNFAAAQPPNPNQTPDPNFNEFNPSFAIIIVILVAALFLMGFFSIYIRQCADSAPNSVLPITHARSRRVARGLDQTVIDTFPVLEYSEVKAHKIGKHALECAVCLSEFEDAETLRLIPKCDHVFHTECIDEWLVNHTTCPVCRANLAPQPADSVHGAPAPESQDVEAQSQNDAVPVHSDPEQHQNTEADRVLPEPEVISLGKTLNRNRTRGSRSNRLRRFSRSHSTGHSVVQPGENTERFTLRLPVGVRKQILDRQLHRASSLIVLPREGSTRLGYRTGGEGSNRGKGSRRVDRGSKSDRWTLSMAPSFLMRALSIRSPRPRVQTSDDEASSSAAAPIMPPGAGDSARPPV